MSRPIRKRTTNRLLSTLLAALALAAAISGTAQSSEPSSPAARGAEPAGAAAAQLEQARRIRREITGRYARPGRRSLVVTEASSTAVVESFRLLTASLDEVRTLPAGNGIFYSICPARASCPYPARRFAREAEALLPRRQALELAARTFAETSADLVAVCLPTLTYTLFVVERAELAREVTPQELADALRGDPSLPAAATLRELVDRITRPRLFVPLGLTGVTGDLVWEGMPLWPVPGNGPIALTTGRRAR